MPIERHVIDITTDAEGNATAFTDHIQSGRVIALFYKADATDPFENTVNLTISLEGTLDYPVFTYESLAAPSGFWMPRFPVHDDIAGERSYDGTNAVTEAMPVASDRLKITITEGGNAKSGRLIILVG